MTDTLRRVELVSAPPAEQQIAGIRQYTVKRTAAILDYSVRTVYRLIDAGELETTGNRHMLRITHTSIVAYQQRILNQKEAC